MFDAYAGKKSVDIGTLRFMTPDGDRIKPGAYDKTVTDLELEDEDCIDVFIEQVGGNRGSEQ